MNNAIIYMECVSRESATVLECMLETVFPVEVMRTNEKNDLLFNLLNNGTTQLMNEKASPCPILISWLYIQGLMNQITGFLHKIEA